MISANEAINIIEANNRILPTIVIDTTDALDYTLANDISSSINFPPFNQNPPFRLYIHILRKVLIV